MNEETMPQGEFHHFQLVNSEGEVPLSISVLVHYNRKNGFEFVDKTPITANDIIDFHEAFKNFDGDYSKAFKANHR
ncbi:MAG: hypothetical protein K0S20_373 [Patescibacteria group bacterium]|jgi:hypothetical protein|nr:hypothetical protein [Patescibacteria group bacterium]